MTTILVDICFDCFNYKIFDAMWNIRISHVSYSNTLTYLLTYSMEQSPS